MRVVSLLPAATEIVAALGAADRLVGVSHECDWPPTVRGLPKVTRSGLDDSPDVVVVALCGFDVPRARLAEATESLAQLIGG